MAINKSSQLNLQQVQGFLGLSWSPVVTATQALREYSLSLIHDSTKNISTIYYLVDNLYEGTSTLLSQSFSYKTSWKTSSKPAKLVTNIYASNDSDAKTKGFYDLEKTLGIDLDGDGLQGSSIFLQTSGTKTLLASDVSPLSGNDQYYISLGLAANGKSGTTLNIVNMGKPLIVGALSISGGVSFF